MSQNTHSVRTRREQLAAYPESVCVGRYSDGSWQLRRDADHLDEDRLIEGPVLYVRCDIAHQSQTEAEERVKGTGRPVYQWRLTPDDNWVTAVDATELEQVRNGYPVSETRTLYTRPANVAGIDVDAVIRNVSELPDRTSPDDKPDLLTVSTDELRQILSDAQPANVAALEAQKSDGWEPIASAPKNGTLVDLWVHPIWSGKARRVIDAWWTDRTGWRSGTEIPIEGKVTFWRHCPPTPGNSAENETTSAALTREGGV